MSKLEERLRYAMHAGLDTIEPSPDLFARVQGSLEDDAARRQWRRRVAAYAGMAMAALGAFVFSVTDYRKGELVMDWWILELLTTATLIAIALFLGPFIKRFGKSYAADVFKTNPGTGKSYIVLTDIAYYLIFMAYIMFTTSFEVGGQWETTVNASQLKGELARVGGILLIMGLLHSVNLVALPVMGRLLTLNRRLDDDMNDGPDGGGPPARRRFKGGGGAALPPGGSWVLRIEPAGPESEVES